MSWNIVDNGDSTYTLLNESETLIRLHRQISIELVLELMSKMEEISFPIKYTKGVKEIYFTYLKSADGDYSHDAKIRINCEKKALSIMPEVFVHEVGHHVDAEECASDDELLLCEWVEKSGSFVHSNIKKDPCEYFAIGFEKYHFPDHSSCNINKRSHPILWSMIDEIHKKKAI